MTGAIPGFQQQWAHWDAVLLTEIARYGYRGDLAYPQDPGLPAFFPGQPFLLRLMHAVIPDWTVAGVVLSLVAGAVAVVALARLAGLGLDLRPNGPGASVDSAAVDSAAVNSSAVDGAADGGAMDSAGEGAAASGGMAARAGRYAVWGLLLSPPAVFLFAGYTEPVFLAFAIPAWLLARRRRWGPAALAAAGASFVRINGLFLAVALVVEFVVARRRQVRDGRAGSPAATGEAAGHGTVRLPEPETRWRSAGWLALPFLPVIGYALYQYSRTGDLFAWQHAQDAGWHRHLVSPALSFLTTWDAAFHSSNVFTWAFRAELVGAVVGVALAVWLAWHRRWSEFAYVGLAVAALISSTYYLSVPREALLWWPLWTGLGRTAARRPRVFGAYAVIAAPLLAVYVVTFTHGAWAG